MLALVYRRARAWSRPSTPSSLRLSLAGQYLVASLLILITTMAILGFWVGDQIESGVLNRTAAVTALYVESIVAPRMQSLAASPRLSDADVAALDRLVSDLPLGDRIVAFKVWSLDGQVLYSPDARLQGQRFPIEGGLANAIRGDVSAELSDLDEPENEFERLRWKRLLEVYVPVREHNTGRLLGVAEFYQLPDDLDQLIMVARLRSWGVVVGVTLVTYLVLVGIVKRGSDTIRRQQVDLRSKVAELTQLLIQNARLQERLHQSAGRASTINEQALRRIGADLHDGPGQSLALALLRLDQVQERLNGVPSADDDFAVVKNAVEDALKELRAVASGLRLPELRSLGIEDVVDRVIRNHERLTGHRIDREVEIIRPDAPVAVKIALYRSLQETLSNAARHAAGSDVRVRVSRADGFLNLVVSDRGPGFDPATVGSAGRLGLAGMREQAELLGGAFDIVAAPGRGTIVDIRWPLAEMEDR